MGTAEIVGYLASGLVAASLMMSNLWRLRWINLLGSSTFAVYGWLIGAVPIIAVNAWIALVNVYYLIRIAQSREQFTAITMSPEDPILNLFIGTYLSDIRKFFPEFDWDREREKSCMLLFRNALPVGLFIYKPKPEGIVEISVDYVIPQYRDLKNGRFLYDEQCRKLRDKGCRILQTRTNVGVHRTYLRKMGFEPDPKDPTLLRRTL